MNKFNAEIAKANVKEYEKQMEKKRNEKASETITQWLETIEKESINGKSTVTLQSNFTDTVNKYIKVKLEILGFQVNKKGQVFKISWL